MTESADHCVLKSLFLHWEGDIPFPMALRNELSKYNDLWFDKKNEFDSSNMETEDLSTLHKNRFKFFFIFSLFFFLPHLFSFIFCFLTFHLRIKNTVHTCMLTRTHMYTLLHCLLLLVYPISRITNPKRAATLEHSK